MAIELDATPAAAVEPPATPAAAPPAPVDWKADVPESYRAEPVLGKYKTRDEAWKGLIEASKLVGAKTDGMVKVPGPDSGPEEIAQFRAKLGVPERADQYGVKLPEAPEGATLDDALFKEMLPVFHEAGLTTAQAQKLVDAYAKHELVSLEHGKAQQGRLLEEYAEGLHKLWKSPLQFEHRVGLGKLALNSKYFSPEGPEGEAIKELMEVREVAEHPGMKALLARIGADTTEARFAEGGQAPLGLTPQTAKAEAERLMADPANGYYNREHPKYQQTRERVRALFEIHSGGAVQRMD